MAHRRRPADGLRVMFYCHALADTLMVAANATALERHLEPDKIKERGSHRQMPHLWHSRFRGERYPNRNTIARHALQDQKSPGYLELPLWRALDYVAGDATGAPDFLKVLPDAFQEQLFTGSGNSDGMRLPMLAIKPKTILRENAVYAFPCLSLLLREALQADCYPHLIAIERCLCLAFQRLFMFPPFSGVRLPVYLFLKRHTLPTAQQRNPGASPDEFPVTFHSPWHEEEEALETVYSTKRSILLALENLGLRFLERDSRDRCLSWIDSGNLVQIHQECQFLMRGEELPGRQAPGDLRWLVWQLARDPLTKPGIVISCLKPRVRKCLFGAAF